MTIYTSEKVLPYVYMGIHRETGQFYIGSRTHRHMTYTPEHDIVKYRTSSKYVKPIFDEFDWHIIAMFFDGKDAWKFEQELIFENWGDPLKLNRSCHINNKHNFSTTGSIIDESNKPNSRFWGVIYPNTNGIKYIKNLNKFCRENNLTAGALIKTASGKTLHHKGFRCFRIMDIDGTPQDQDLVAGMLMVTIPEPYQYKIISPSNIEYVVHTLKPFCKENGLDLSSMCEVVVGNRKHHKKWRVFKITSDCEYLDKNLYTKSISPKHSYKIVDPSGKEYLFNRLDTFCRDNNLRKINVDITIFNEITPGNFFRCFKLLNDGNISELHSLYEIKYTKTYSYKILSPQNKEYISNNLRNFCRLHGLNYGGMHLVSGGCILHYKQWKVFKIDANGQYLDTNLVNTMLEYKPTIRSYKLVDSSGKEYVTDNLKDFCKQHGLQSTCMCKVASNNRSHHKGWKCYYL